MWVLLLGLRVNGVGPVASYLRSRGLTVSNLEIRVRVKTSTIIPPLVKIRHLTTPIAKPRS